MKEEIIRKELNEVWLNQAKETSLGDGNIEEFYRRSGNKFIINEIIKYLTDQKCEPKLVFFEHSYFATTLDENKYTVFTCIWKTEKLPETQVKRFLHFFSSKDQGLDKFEKIYPILWHPEFFISRESVSFYISESKNPQANLTFNVSDYVKEEYKDGNQIYLVPNLSNGESVYVGNFPFTLQFEELVKGIIEQKKNKSRIWDPIEENTERIRIAYDTIFEKDEKEFSYKLAIPILGSPVDEKSEYVGQGSIWIYIISKNEIELETLKHLAKEIAGYFKDISINYIFQSGLEHAKTSIKQATRAAIAQVMARNMSHNIGSHVLNKVYNQLTDISRSQSRSELTKAAHLYEFIQKRMEFIANGVTASFQSSHHLFEEILPAYLNSTEAEQIKRQLLQSLFDNISGNEGVKSNNIVFGKSDNDILVSIPNGTLGFHAIYTLFENIIRNSVKHNQQYPDNENLVYTICIVSDKEYSDFYKVSVTDNFGKINTEKELDVAALNNKMNQLILDKGGLRPNHWGLMEMKICATYLLGLPIDLIDSANNNGNKIPIHGIEQSFPKALVISEDTNGNLIHTFYLQKPKIAAINGANFQQFESPGIELVTNQEAFEKFGSKHLFAVFDKSNSNTRHEYEANQRSVFFETTSSKRVNINEDLLWEQYSEQKKWNADDVKIISKDNNFIPDAKNRYIIFDQHDEWAKQNGNWEKVLSSPNKFLYYEYVSAQSATNTGVCNVIQQNSNSIDNILRAKIFEMAFTDIIVLDERIQKNFGAEKLNFPNKLNPKFANLFIPPFEGATNLDIAKTDDIIKWAEKIPEFRQGYKLNYLVIHRSIIGDERINIRELQSKLKPDFTIFVSGGGTPPNLEEGEFYLPFDVLNYCLGANPSKFALVGILKSLRKINKR